MRLVILLATFLMGCASATMVNRPGSSGSQYAPSNENERPGTIKYLNDGADFIIKGRREDAYKQMSEACGGKYKILHEGPNSEGGVIAPVGNMYTYAQSNYWYITFKCE